MNNPYAQLGTADLVFNKESRKDEDNPDSYWIQVSYTVNSEKLDDVVLVKMKFIENDDSSVMLDTIKAKIHKGMNYDSPYFYSPMYSMDSKVFLLFDNFMIHVLKSLINDNIIVELSNIKRAKECGDKDILRFGYLKDCLDVLATYMNPKDFEAYKISIYNKAVEVYCRRYITKNPVTGDILVLTNDFVFSKYKGKESLYIEAAKRKTMFPLPLWNLLEDEDLQESQKDLQESQKEIKFLLENSEDLIYTRSGVLKAKDFLPLVDSMFTWIREESDCKSLLSYFKKCEADFWSNYDIFARDSSRRRSWGNKVLWLEEEMFPIIGDIHNLNPWFDPRAYIGDLGSNDLFFIIYCIAYLIGGKSIEQYFVNKPYKRTDSIVAFRKEDNRKYVRSITDRCGVRSDISRYI